MSNKAKLYVACTLTAGLTTLAMGFFQWSSPSLPRFFVYLLFGLLASTLKVRVPGITGTISASFLFVLIGIADYTFPETLVVGCAAALVQSVWKAKQRPKAVQILFNVASWAISIAISYWASHFVLAATRANSLPLLLTMAACLFFVTHTGFVAIVISLTTEKSVKDVWQQCCAWTFPYYLVGAAIAGLLSVTSRSVGWQISLLMLPVMYLTYVCYRLYLERVAEKQT